MRALTSFQELYCVSNKTAPVTTEELRSAEASIGTAFPAGYAELMLTFGEGDIDGYIRPYRPQRIVEELKMTREALAYDFWEEGTIRLTPEQKARLVPFADTIDSDLLAFLPEKPSEIYAFPRHKTELFKLGPSFLDVVNWVSSSGIIVQPFECTFFQPWNDYASLRLDHPSAYFEIEEMKSIFENLGRPDLLTVKEQSIDFFLRNYGARLSYLLHNDYLQFIVNFDSETADDFLSLLKTVLRDTGFQVTESNRVKVPENFL
ncbi:SMI1/KNR4 family protein [Pedosphaera parvula]|uniref:Knr4/Smi1-like domain-containing protein n=1 Tax=Pedosphaera parvula (strain Ellin514) TaxID=320771 RepID=B9XEY4_PEDPL|nr:SMI1/KNR4 family protein [Pedosphaera parvula]EEF61482.1 hypothetical protein Cflav_PD4160 [Pedosphaera parvula Ellin514]